MQIARVFKSGRSQAVRLPKEFRFKSDEIGISRLGDLVILHPSGKKWDSLTRAIALFSEDFMADRAQPERVSRRARL